MSDIMDPSKLKVAELRAELQARGLDSKGNKPVLVDRLRAALEEEAACEEGDDVGGGEEEEEAVGEEEIQEEVTETQVETEEERDVPVAAKEPEPPQQEPEVAKKSSESPVKKTVSPQKEPGSSPKKPEPEPSRNAPQPEPEVKTEPEDSAKLGYEDAPMEELADKSDAGNGMDVNVKEEELEIKEEAVEVKQEVSETEESGSTSRRGEKRALSRSRSPEPAPDAKKQRPEVEEVRVEDEPEFDKTIVALDWSLAEMASTQQYKQEQVEKAVELVRSKQMSLNAASKTFGIPYATLGDKVRGRRPMLPAPKTVLSMEEEKKLVDWLIEVSKRGFGRTKDDLKDMVKTILDDREERTVFKNNRPGKDWMRAFFKRHPEIRERIGQPLGRERAIVTKDALGEWFQQMKHYLDTIDPTLLTSPDRIFNADESGFNICPKTKKIISMTGPKHVYSVTSGKRQQVTMLACSSAMGQYLPPLLIFPYTRDPRFNALEGFEEAFFQKTPNGWITEVVFLSFLRDIFIPKLGEKRPVVLFVDGHSSHHSLAICTLCNENGVILYCLKAHASHLIQPLDQAFFGAIKLAWSEAVRKFQYQTGESVTMCTFARTLKKAWDTTARPELAYKGFVKSGIYPFNPEVVLNSDKLKPSCSFSSAAPVTLPTSASFGITALPACTPTISTSVPSASPAAKSKFPGPEQRTPTLSAFSNIFELMKLSLSLGEGTTLKFMKRYEERYDMDDPPYEDWKVLLEKTLQPASQSLPSTSQPASQPLPSTYQAASQTLPSTSQPASQPLLYTSQAASQTLPSTSQPASQSLLYTSQAASQPLPSTSQPASQPLPYTSQPASQPLPSTSQPAPQPLPYTSQPAPQPLPSTKKNSKTIDDYLTLPSFPKKKGLKKTIAVLPCSISGVEYRQMIEEKQRKKREEEREKMERKRKRREKKNYRTRS